MQRTFNAKKPRRQGARVLKTNPGNNWHHRLVCGRCQWFRLIFHFICFAVLSVNFVAFREDFSKARRDTGAEE
jgi:hypothetical protein